MKSIIILFSLIFFITSFQTQNVSNTPYLVVLGVAQDGGYPQINCERECCKKAWENPSLKRMTSCLAIVDPITQQQWIIDATPNIKEQLQLLKRSSGTSKIEGVFLTHAHMGHYTGLLHFGREVMGTKNIPVFAMPRMKTFLEKNDPWSQLVELQNIKLQELSSDSIITLNERIRIKPFLVPHRDEFSETVGYEILIGKKSVVFIPDIDKWEKWNRSIVEMIRKCDYAFLDATFYKNGELERDMREIPHPFVEESMLLFSDLSVKDKSKIYFIHLNHTNPLLQDGNPARTEVEKKGFKLAKQGQLIVF